ncbi:MAG: tetraacyldisaccharide 4'-kinase [Bacteroidaceae bacterium]|nr:tetraacyldisaccharide 4'-kinase [Bacteroidaceae bacterium]
MDTQLKKHGYLWPFSFLYGLGVAIRNRFFDWGILPSEEFNIPIISVGNITVGGTGKTPHIEYLIRLLSPQYRVAVLSRGYKRKSRGFVLANENSTDIELGDEAYQIKRKFPNLIVAVDANRREGIKKLMKLTPQIDIILLDDAYQHRYVKPGVSILLTDYNRIIYKDKLLPVGRLREPAYERMRAGMVIVTKCPLDIKPIDFRIIQKHLDLFSYQSLYFTSYAYSELQPVFPECVTFTKYLRQEKEHDTILLVTGIASSHTIKQQVELSAQNVIEINFADHHKFTKKDIQRITDKLLSLSKKDAFIIITEKDAARLLNMPNLSPELKSKLYYLPVEVEFLQNQKDDFNKKIEGYVRKNRRNSTLSK